MRCTPRLILAHLVYPVSWLGQRLLIRMGESLEYDGFTIVDTTGLGQSLETTFQVRRALELIAHHDPVRYRRMKRDIPRTLIVPNIGSTYWRPSRSGVVGREPAQFRSAATIAVMLVDAATRARLAPATLAGALQPGVQDRIGIRAVRSQIAFVDRLPPADFPGIETLRAYFDDQLASRIAARA